LRSGPPGNHDFRASKPSIAFFYLSSRSLAPPSCLLPWVTALLIVGYKETALCPFFLLEVFCSRFYKRSRFLRATPYRPAPLSSSPFSLPSPLPHWSTAKKEEHPLGFGIGFFLEVKRRTRGKWVSSLSLFFSISRWSYPGRRAFPKKLLDPRSEVFHILFLTFLLSPVFLWEVLLGDYFSASLSGLGILFA